MKKILTLLSAAILALTTSARAYIHPGIPLTTPDLVALKANLNTEPWKSAYAALAADGHSQLSYTMQGPFSTVSRNPDVNLNQWKNDMQAVWNLSRMWYFTDNAAYAQKAHDIWMAWVNTVTGFGGAEMSFALGDYAPRAIGGLDLLRGTWPGWTAADTTVSQNHLRDKWLPWSPVPNPLRSAGQGSEDLIFSVGIGFFNDDENLVNQSLRSFREDAVGGLANSLPNGEVGDSGRDQGHLYGHLLRLAWCAEVFWKQGIDVYGDLDNRLLAGGEIFSRYNLSVNTPYVPFGTKYDYYWGGFGGAPESSPQPPDGLNLIHGAYVVRKGMNAPYLSQYRATRPETMDSFMYLKSADSSMATPPAPVPPLAPTAAVTTGFSNADIGGATPAGSGTYNNGTWTVTGAGTDIWGASDSGHFTYKQVTGDFTMIARLTSLSPIFNPSTKAGIVMRDSLAADAPRRIWFGYIPGATVPLIESHQRGYTANSHNDPDEVTHDGPTPMLPHWMKIQRIGSRVTVFHSPDGGSWTALQNSEYAGWSDTAYVGFAVCSRIDGSLTSATFTDVRFTGGDGGEAAKIPEAPFAVYASPGNRQVPLRWLESFGATSYNVKRATATGGPYTTLATVAGTSYVDLSAVNGMTYYYAVSAVNSVGEGSNSPEDIVTLPVPLPINFATGGTATASAQSSPGETAVKAFDGAVATKWFNANLGATGWLQYDLGSGNAKVVQGYDLTSANDVPGRDPKDWQFQGSNDGSVWTTLDTRTGETFATRYQNKVFLIGNTTAYRHYRLNITANNGDVAGVQLAELALRGVATTAPAIPAAPSATAISHEEVSLSWTAVSGAESYNVKRATTPGGPYAKIASPLGTSFIDTGLSSSTTYYYVISAVSAALESSNSVQASAPTQAASIPSAPTGLAAAPAGNTRINLSWNAVSGVSTYKVKRSNTSGGPYTLVAYITGTTCGNTGLIPNNGYYYVVSAISANDESANSVEVNATTTYVLQNSATGGIATASAQSSPNEVAGYGFDGLTSTKWFNGNGGNTGWLQYNYGPGNVWRVVRYDVGSANDAPGRDPKNWQFQGSNDGANWTTLDTRTGETFASRYLTKQYAISNNTAYQYYRLNITANNGDALGIQLSELALMAYDGISLVPPSAPTGLSSTAASTSQINLSWSAATGATSYTVKRTTVSGGPYTTISSPTATSYADTGLSSGTSYYYVVTAVNTIGESAASNQASSLTIPASPQNVSVTAGDGQATISWGASTGASGYTIERATSAGGPFTIVASGVTGLSYLDTGLSNGTSYYYRVSAGNASGSSATSSVSSGITLPAAPTGLAATAGNTTVSLIWNASTGADTYSVLRSTTSGSGYAVIASGLTATSYNDSGLANGTAYYYVVNATNVSGTSAVSTQASATPVGLPSPWSTLDVGAVAATGTANYNAGTFTIEGSGVDVAGSADEFRYVYQSASGDCDIIARVTGIENTSTSAKAGIVIRESTATGSRYAGVFLTQGGQARFQRRTSTNGTTSTNTASAITVPRYIRLTRTGNTFNAYHSTNGTAWTQFGGSRSVTMSTAVSIGLGVNSFVDGTLCTGTFTNVIVIP